MKSIYIINGIIFTLISLVEIITGFAWEYRIFNGIALASFCAYWQAPQKPKMVVPLAQQKIIEETDAI